MENGKLLQEIHAKVSRLDERSIETDKKLDKLNEVFEPAGVCETARSRVDRAWSHLKVQWWFIGGISISILMLAIFIIRTKVAG